MAVPSLNLRHTHSLTPLFPFCFTSALYCPSRGNLVCSAVQHTRDKADSRDITINNHNHNKNKKDKISLSIEQWIFQNNKTTLIMIQVSRPNGVKKFLLSLTTKSAFKCLLKRYMNKMHDYYYCYYYYYCDLYTALVTCATFLQRD